MGTHPIFESDFDCLTEIECWFSVVLVCWLLVLDWPLLAPLFSRRKIKFPSRINFGCAIRSRLKTAFTSTSTLSVLLLASPLFLLWDVWLFRVTFSWTRLALRRGSRTVSGASRP